METSVKHFGLAVGP